MAGFDALTEFRAMGVPVGGGVAVAVGNALGDAVGGLVNRLLGAQVGRAAPALGQVAAAYVVRLPAIDRFVGASTSDIWSMVWVAKALNSALGLESMVRGLLAQVGLPALSAGPGRSLGQAPAPQRVFRTDVARKATLTRL